MHQENGRKSRTKRAKRGRRERFDWWKLPWLLLIPLGLIWPRICAGRAEWIERYYSAGVYPTVKNAASVLTSLVPISVAELVLYALVLFTLIELFGTLVAWALRRVNWRRVLSVVLNLGIAAGVLLNLFYFTWGFNYFRTPLQARMGLSARAYSVTELTKLTAYLAAEANAERALVAEDARGVCTFTTSLQETLDALPLAYDALGASMPVFAGRTTRAKRVLYSEGLSWAGIAGIFVGLTGEPNINAGQPMLLIPQGAAHEMAHQLGVASEDAAEFTGHLACLASSDPAVRYSGLVSALLTCGNALFSEDRAAYAEVRSTYCDGLKRDLADYDAYWEAYEGPIEELSDQTNDAYLKHNAQESGVKSYGEAVDLLLAYYGQTIR